MQAPSKKAHVLLEYPRFLLLFLARFISSTGDKVFTIALSVWIVSHGTHSSKMHLGLLLAMNTLPVVIFGPFAGALADRFNRKVCMLVADGMRCAILVLVSLALITDQFHLSVMYIACFLLATFVPLFNSSADASVTHLVDAEDVPKAVAVNGSVTNMSEIIGASLGGLLVATIHFEGALFFNAGTFLVSFICIAFIRQKLVAKNRDEDAQYWGEIIDGFRYLVSNRSTATLLIVLGLVNFFTASVFVLIPILVKFQFDLHVAGWVAAYETSLALGAGVTALVLSFVDGHDRIYPKISLSLGLMALGYVLTGISSQPAIVCLYLLMAGIGLAVINTLVLGLLQNVVPDEMKGRFFAMLATVCFAAIPVSYIINGYITQIITASTAFVINGSMIGVIAGVMLFLPRIRQEIDGT